MSLRRSPRRTPAFLAANRANAQKSTGPRTDAGKQRSAANSFRNGNRASAAFWTRGLSRRELAEFHALRDAIDRALCAGSKGQKLVGVVTDMVWSVRRYAERQLRTLPPEKRRLLGNPLVPVARCWHRAIPLPGWKVTVTVLARRGRCRRCDLSLIPAVGAIRMPQARPARLHVITKVTCTGHPLFNRGPEGVPLSTKPGAKAPEIRSNPEYSTKQANWANVSPNANCPEARSGGIPSLRSGQAPSLRSGQARPALGGLRQRQRRQAALEKQEQQRAGRPRSQANSPPRETQSVDDNAPPWELPEGYSWVGTERKGSGGNP